MKRIRLKEADGPTSYCYEHFVFRLDPFSSKGIPQEIDDDAAGPLLDTGLFEVVDDTASDLSSKATVEPGTGAIQMASARGTLRTWLKRPTT